MVELSESGEKPLNRRQLSKVRTRQGVMDAGRALFMEGGYADATIRDIAKRIPRGPDKPRGMSTGAVFANFDSKADLLLSVVEEELQLHKELLDLAVFEDGTMLERITKICTSDFVFFKDRLHLMEALASLETAVEPEAANPHATAERARSATLSRRMQVWHPIHDCLERSGPSDIMRIVAETGLVAGFHLHACREAALQGQKGSEYQSSLRKDLARAFFRGEQSLCA